jgi:AcrR family transcriptional regulator
MTMRYEKGHKETTRHRIIEVASQRFRQDGVAASGLSGIMTEAGLTNGAFYPHFESKEALVRDTVAYALNCQHEKLKETLQKAGIEAAIRGYLSMDHLNALGKGCPSAALVPEIARASEETRAAYFTGLEEYVATLAEYLPEATPKTASQRAMALFGLMLGTLQIARAAPEPAVAKAILNNGIKTALMLIRENPDAREETFR